MAGQDDREQQIARIIGAIAQGYQYNPDWPARPVPQAAPSVDELRAFFDARMSGPGIWKWLHYFDIYERYFGRLRHRPIHVLEIGIYSGGSLDMWRHYFGPHAKIYGVDIEPACRVYEKEGTRIFIGDQADRSFWRRFREEVPELDIVIDDGGHRPDQQATTLEELLPHLRPGGVYLCEDIHGAFNLFACYAQGLVHKLNDFAPTMPGLNDPGMPPLLSAVTPFQAAIGALHFHPYVLVIERNTQSVKGFAAPKHGTEWQPFL